MEALGDHALEAGVAGRREQRFASLEWIEDPRSRALEF
jgi:hypothetical protein